MALDESVAEDSRQLRRAMAKLGIRLLTKANEGLEESRQEEMEKMVNRIKQRLNDLQAQEDTRHLPTPRVSMSE